MADFMLDRGFLQEVNKYRVKTYYAAITILDFQTERPITRLEGQVVSGSMQISSKSSTRRTGSMQIVFDKNTFDLTNTNNLIAINKKISLSVGLSNPFYNSGLYREYGDVLWFKQGIFLITSASSSVSITSRAINIQFIDKMGMLNGTCGGVLPASVSFHDKIIIDPNENMTTLYPLIKEIVAECVNHFGGEHPSKIIIDDIPSFGRQVVTWGSSIPVWFAENSGAFVVSNSAQTGFPNQKIIGDDIGYMATKLTYPGELVMKGGSTVTAVLDEIVKTLGNFEYFYDVDGIFHFQQIRNFDKTGQAPMIGSNTNSNTPFNISTDPIIEAQFQAQYLPKFRSDQFLNEFSDTSLISAASLNPQYSNIKNDFVVWGSRKTNTGKEQLVRYHLAIDSRPKEDAQISLCYRNIWVVRNASTKQINRYYAKLDNPSIPSISIPSLGEVGDLVGSAVNYRGDYSALATYKFSGIPDSVKSGTDYYALQYTNETVAGIVGKPPSDPNYWRKLDPTDEEILLHSPALTKLPAGAPRFDWREELYRRALMAYNSSNRGSYYDEELSAEWRLIFNPNYRLVDPNSAIQGYVNPYWSNFKADWEDHFNDGAVPWGGYNVDVVRKPQNIRYWLDLIDTNSGLGPYSVDQIGRRSIVVENNKINEVLNREIPNIVFIDGTSTPDEINAAEQEFIAIGQKYCIVRSNYLPYFQVRNSFGTCYEEIRDLLYTHLIYNASVSLTSIPILYLDVNKVIRLNFSELGIVGNYTINSMSWNIGNTSTMSLQLNEAIVVV
jgi:hypothetical protein